MSMEIRLGHLDIILKLKRDKIRTGETSTKYHIPENVQEVHCNHLNSFKSLSFASIYIEQSSQKCLIRQMHL